MPHVEIDRATDKLLTFAANVAKVSKGELIAQLVEQHSTSAYVDHSSRPAVVDVYADYEGERTHARFHLAGHRIEIMSGPLAGQSFKTPSQAARAVVSHYKPQVNPSRNGWIFWLVDGSHAPLQSLRRRSL